MKYRKKPIVVEAIKAKHLFEAIQRTTKTLTQEMMEAVDFFGKSVTFNSHPLDPNLITSINIRTLEGTMRAMYDDYIIKGIKGELYPCRPDIFEETYEKV